jgi:hypothetical protein
MCFDIVKLFAVRLPRTWHQSFMPALGAGATQGIVGDLNGDVERPVVADRDPTQLAVADP